VAWTNSFVRVNKLINSQQELLIFLDIPAFFVNYTKGLTKGQKVPYTNKQQIIFSS